MSRTDRIRDTRTHGRARWFAPSLACLIFASLLAGPLAPAAHAFPGKLMPASGIYFGSRVGPRGNESGREALERVESRIGRSFAIDHQYYSWNVKIPTAHQEWDADTGRIPFVNWSAGGSGGTRWNAIANGSEDAWIRDRADAFKDFGAPIYLTFHHEPEDDLSSFGSASDYAAAFRRIVTVFRSRSVTNVAFVWTMMAWTFNPRSGRDPNPYYPGDSYVDFVGGDGYNWYPGRRGDAWNSFQTIFQDINAFAVAHRKPWLVVEYGVQEDPASPGRKGAWFRDALATAKTWPSLKAMIYFDMFKLYEWDTDTSSSSMSEYRRIANDPYTNGGASPNPSPPPSPSPSPPPTGSWSNTLDVGPDGARIQASGSGGGSPFAYVLTDQRSTLTYDDEHRLGSYSAKHVVGSGGDAYYAWSGTKSIWYGRVYVWFDGLPSSDLRLIQGTMDNRQRCAIELRSNGSLEVLDKRGRTIIATSEAIRTGRWVRIEWMFDHGRGAVEVRFFNSGTGTRPSAVATSGTGNAIGSSADQFQFGRSGRQSFSFTFWTDRPALSSSSYPGP